MLILPLCAAAVWLRRHDRWAPVFDLAFVEVRVRDVGTAHTPLLGLPGRLGRAQTGSHPGPLAFYLLAPLHRLLGGSYWALRASMIALDSVAILSALALARRRAGAAAVVATGVVVSWLELGFGPVVLTEPWNPYLPVLWLMPFLLAVWGVVAGDLGMLAVAAAVGSFCAQTHIPYLAICGGLGLFALAHVVGSWWLAWRRRLPGGPYARAIATSAAVLGVLWAPPLIEQWTHKPGNFSVLFDYFSRPPGVSVGLGPALGLVLAHLDPWQLAVTAFRGPGIFCHFLDVRAPSPARGAAFLLVWMVAAVVAWRSGHRTLRALHEVAAATLAVSLLSVSRIIGIPWGYLLFPLWSVGALLLLAVGGTAALAISRRCMARPGMRGALSGAVGLATLAACSVRMGLEASVSAGHAPRQMSQLAELVPGTVAAILRRVGGATGREGRYLVTWADGVNGGGQGFGLVDELERRGFHVGVPAGFSVGMTPHRVLRPERATARIHLATGGWIRPAKHSRGAIQVAASDPRTPEERQEFSRLRDSVATHLRGLGRADLAASLDRDLIAPGGVPGLHFFAALGLFRMGEIGADAAVFIQPAGGR